MEEERLFEALDKFPETVKKVDELVDAVKANNKTMSTSVQNITETIDGLESRFSQMEQGLTSLKESVRTETDEFKKGLNTYQKGVTVDQKPLSVSQLETMAEILANKTNYRVKERNTASNVLLFVSVFFLTICALSYTKMDNDFRSWADRYVEIGVVAGDMHPGDRFVYIKEEFNKGRRYRKAAKALVKAQEEKYDETYKQSTRIISKDLTKALKDEAVVLDYYLIESDSLGYEAFSIFRPIDEEKRLAAHSLKNGDVFVNNDDDLIIAAEIAKQHPGRKTWKMVGNYK